MPACPLPDCVDTPYTPQGYMDITKIAQLLMGAFMNGSLLCTNARVMLPILALALTSACSSPVVKTSQNNVMQAFETSGIVAVQPYTRSIFNSQNF